MNESNHARRRGWYLLLLAPFIGLLFPGWYATRSPELFGFPFFYWYQFAWVIGAALITGLVYVLTRAPESDREDRA
ncbi:MAG TPA: DUF3311 domain-containing protein [Thermoleophilaceae bacterium]